ncbi:hypothetical protein [Bacillus horti]|uniref:Zn-dependent protease n=1 Tax=Caldalkalibacillus horti TaxID=77523 RepID=A0ABT9W0G6_9BACI|nr:hypothetical protein [Bacillus horti]MDQ0166747.1 putative Zn-dependent protease [Bacillus horti]
MLKRLFITIFSVFLIFSLSNIISYANNLGTLSYWYANEESADRIGRWLSTPTAWQGPIDNSFTSSVFNGHVTHAKNQWSNAGISRANFFNTDDVSNANFIIRAGTYENLRRYRPDLDDTAAGETFIAGNVEGNWTYSNSTKTGVRISRAEAYIYYFSNQNSNYHRNTFIHEIGHGLGWFGHSTNSSDLMGGDSTRTSLTTRDQRHLNQVY